VCIAAKHIASRWKHEVHTLRVDTLWRQGWYQFARHIRSPNFGPRPPSAEVDLVVVHAISLPPGQYGGPEVQALFTNTLDWDAHPYVEQIRGMAVVMTGPGMQDARTTGDATIATTTRLGLNSKAWMASVLKNHSTKRWGT